MFIFNNLRSNTLMYNQIMLEIHPFGDFVPSNARFLLLGSFTTKPATGYEWFYANGRNQFWPIMSVVYGLELNTKEKQQQLFVKLNMALADIIHSCERKANSNLDMNLTNITINNVGIDKIIRKNNFKAIFFSSRFVETLFRKHFKYILKEFPDIHLVTLPSPSPRYAVMSKTQKIEKYRDLLPRMAVVI